MTSAFVNVFKEIRTITEQLIECNLSINQNFPINREKKVIVWQGQTDISLALKNISYEEIYEEIDKAKNYNIKMLDGALIQIMYSFSNRGKQLAAHRLAFFPSPHKESYDENPQAYEELYFGECVYYDIVMKHAIRFPIRFDYDDDSSKHVDMVHPKSHLHLGQYEHCRIPVRSPLTPNTFIKFILRNFYYSAYERLSFKKHSASFKYSITKKEESLVHVSFID